MTARNEMPGSAWFLDLHSVLTFSLVEMTGLANNHGVTQAAIGTTGFLMPILKKEPDIYPENLFDDTALLSDDSRRWWCIYTMSRREKDLMRKLHSQQIPFYGPVIGKRFRSPNGRLRTSYVPLFANYVFLFGNETEKYEAAKTNCISKCSEIPDSELLIHDLRQVHAACQAGVPLTPEAKLQAGDQVRVRTGPFAGYDGLVIRREGKTRLLLSVRFLEQGVSMEIDEGLLEAII